MGSIPFESTRLFSDGIHPVWKLSLPAALVTIIIIIIIITTG